MPSIPSLKSSKPSPFDCVEVPGAQAAESRKVRDELWHLERTCSNVQSSNQDVALAVDDLSKAVGDLEEKVVELVDCFETMQGVLGPLVAVLTRLATVAEARDAART